MADEGWTSPILVGSTARQCTHAQQKPCSMSPLQAQQQCSGASQLPMHSDCACTGGAPQHSTRRPGLSAIGGCPDSAPGPMAMPLAMLHRHQCQEQTTAAASIASKAADHMLHSAHYVPGSRHPHVSEHAGQHKSNLPTNSARSRIKAKRLMPGRQHMQPSVCADQGTHALSASVYAQRAAAGTLVAPCQIDRPEAPHHQSPASARAAMVHSDGGTRDAMDVDHVNQHPALAPVAYRAKAQDNFAQAVHGVKLCVFSAQQILWIHLQFACQTPRKTCTQCDLQDRSACTQITLSVRLGPM